MSNPGIGQWVTHKGRMSRAPFWGITLLLWALFALLYSSIERSLGRGATWVLYPPFLWLLFAAMSRRLHDRGQSAWSLLWLALPVLGPLWLFISLGMRAGTAGDNQYGPDPLTINVDYLAVKTP